MPQGDLCITWLGHASFKLDSPSGEGDEAAHAVKLRGVRQVIPMHFGTFPVLVGFPAGLREALKDQPVEVVVMQPGETR